MIDRMNTHHHKHIVTIEDPIEFLHRDKNSIINQREVGQDTLSFKAALKRVLRQDPDVILVGEMRDEETVRTALSAAETGHLVLSTLHTVDAPESINRIIDFFPAELERQARSMLAGTLRGIISQRLIKTGDGRSRVPAIEVMVGTARIADAIENPDETGTIHDAIAEGAYYGMQSFDQSLLQLVMDNAVTVEEAMMHASSKQNFALLLEANNVQIDKQLRRVAAGSQNAAQDDLAFDAARRNVPVPVPTAPVHAPGHAASTYDPAALAPAATEYLPAIGGQPANAHLNFPGAHPAHPAEAAHPAHPAQAQPVQGQVTQGPGGPQQPRPQPGIVPDLPGHNAA
jgi:hypothetical protein